MPVSPDLAANLSRTLVDLYLGAEAHLLEVVARRAMDGVNEPMWAVRKLAEMGGLRRDLEATIRTLNQQLPRAADETITAAWGLGATSAHADLTRLGTTVQFGRFNVGRVRGMVEELVTNVQSTHLRILRSTVDSYQRVIAEGAGQVLTGSMTRRQATQLALNRFADQGISGFVDRTGRAWNLPSYVETATRSATGRAAVSGHLESLVDAGHDLVIVSDSPRECPLCRPWEGEILSITGRTARYRMLAEAEASGLFHANCTHSTGIYIEGVTRPLRNTADPAGDIAKQEQRYLERGVRRWKRRSAVGDPSAAAKVREWQGRLREHVEAKGLKRLRYREQVQGPRHLPSGPTPPTPGLPPAPPPSAAKTAKAAQALAENDPVLGSTPSGRTRVYDYAGMDVDVANSLNATFSRLFNDYPTVAERVQYIGTQLGFRKRTARNFRYPPRALMWTEQQTGAIASLPKFHKSASTAISNLKRWGPDGDHWLSGDTLEHVASHEFGHQVFWELRKVYPGSTDDLMRELADAFADGLGVDRSKVMVSGPHFFTPDADVRRAWIRELSQYSTTNTDEVMAEAFGEYVSSPNPRPVARELGRVIDKYLKGRTP